MGADRTLSLYFKLKEGEVADFEVLSAANAWIETIRAVAKSNDPEMDVRVGLVDAHQGSLNFNTLIDLYKRSVENPIVRFPHFSRDELAFRTVV